MPYLTNFEGLVAPRGAPNLAHFSIDFGFVVIKLGVDLGIELGADLGISLRSNLDFIPKMSFRVCFGYSWRCSYDHRQQD